MADDDRNKRNKQGDNSGGEVAGEMLKLVGRFIVDFGRLSGKAVWQAYRRISSGGDKQSSNKTTSDEPNMFVKLYRIASHRVRGGEKDDSAAETTPAEATDIPVRRQRKTPTDEGGYLDRSAVEDEEAAALLEDLLRETETDLRQRGVAPTEDTAPMPEAVPTEPIPPVAEEPEPETETETPAISIEEQLRQRAEALKEQQRLNADGTPHTEAIENEDEVDDEPAITYNTPEELARIEAKLQAKEKLREQEQRERAAKAAAEESERERLRKEMEADKARIQAEQEARTARFAEAERERKAREKEREATARRARLGDNSPSDDEASDTDAPNIQQTTRNED